MTGARNIHWTLSVLFVAVASACGNSFREAQGDAAADAGADAGAGDGAIEDSTILTPPDASTTDAPQDGLAQIVSSGGTTCVLTRGGSVWCWGDNQLGELGNGAYDTLAHSTPSQIVGLTNVQKLFAGNGSHLCALKSDRTLWCWGDNSFGQLGHSNATDAGADGGDVECNGSSCNVRPTRVAALTDVIDAALGVDHTCARTVAGTVYCFGENFYGQLGHSPFDDTLVCKGNPCTPVPTVVLGVPDAGGLAAGGSHSCAGGSGGVVCWGINDHSQIGLQPTDLQPHPSPGFIAGFRPTTLSAGGFTTCGVSSSKASCLGGNDFGELAMPLDAGNAYAVPQDLPIANAKAVQPSVWLTCVLRNDKTVWCFGLAVDGVLGVREDAGGVTQCGPAICRPTPAQVGGVSNVAELAVGGGYVCVREEDDTVWCWGMNSAGQLGHSETLDGHCSNGLFCNPTPMLVRGLPVPADH